MWLMLFPLKLIAYMEIDDQVHYVHDVYDKTLQNF